MALRRLKVQESRLSRFRLNKLIYAVPFLIIWIGGSATAYDNQVTNNLLRTRDALLDQKTHLQTAADQIGSKIDTLQRQLDTVNQYLNDTDKALRDVEIAIDRTR